jgi:hypothetical protein
MRFASSHLSSRLYPFLELSGLIIGIFFLTAVIRGSFDIDNQLEPLSLQIQAKLVLLVLLAWGSTFLFLEKKKLSLFNTGLVTGIAAILIRLYNTISALFNDQSPTNLRLQIEQEAGLFVVWFVTMFFFSAITQLMVAAFFRLSKRKLDI